MLKRFRIVLPRDEYKALSNLVLARDRFRCRHCKTRNNLHLHHVIFRSQGGNDSSDNLITLCSNFDGGGCHEAAHRGDLVIVNPLDKYTPVDADKRVGFGRKSGWNPQ
jgi:hypothetical protein